MYNKIYINAFSGYKCVVYIYEMQRYGSREFKIFISNIKTF